MMTRLRNNPFESYEPASALHCSSVRRGPITAQPWPSSSPAIFAQSRDATRSRAPLASILTARVLMMEFLRSLVEGRLDSSLDLMIEERRSAGTPVLASELKTIAARLPRRRGDPCRTEDRAPALRAS